MKPVLLSVFSLYGASVVAAIPIDGWYGSVLGGYTNMPDNLKVLHASVFRNKARYQGGFNAGGNVGYQSHPMRYELEVTYLQNNIERFNVNNVRQTAVRGTNDVIIAGGNALYAFDEWVPTLAPFLGVGIGYGFLDGRFISLSPYMTYYRPEDSVLVWQGLAGLSFNFSENYSLTLNYRYVITTKSDEFGQLFQANLLTAGVTYRFNDALYK